MGKCTGKSSLRKRVCFDMAGPWFLIYNLYRLVMFLMGGMGDVFTVRVLKLIFVVLG